MKYKLSLLVLLTAFLSLAMVSAADFSLSLSNDLTKSTDSTILTITNPTNATITINALTIEAFDDGDNHDIALSNNFSGPVSIEAGKNIKVNISHALSDNEKEDLALGTFPTTITVTDSAASSKTLTLNFISGYCQYGELKEEITDGDRYLEITSISDKSSSSDWRWKPLDEVDVAVKVKFISDDSDDSLDGIIKLGLYDTTNNEFIEFENDDNSETDFSLDEGDSTTETLTVIVPADIESSSSRYRLYVKAYQDGDEDVVCTDHKSADYFQDIEIKKESYSVILNDLAITSPVPCSGEVQVTGTIYNVGNHDESKTRVRITNSELNLDYTSDVFNLDMGDSQKFTLTFAVPKDADEKSYALNAWTEFRYSKSSEEYNDKSDTYSLKLDVAGNCKSSETSGENAQITAELDPETPTAVPGKQVIIKATLENTGEVETTYTVSVTGNSGWSSLNTIDPKTITLAPGDSKDVSIYLDIDKAATGEKEFTIRASYNGKTTEQTVALALESGSASQNAILNHIQQNWFIYVIALINIILIIAIIMVVRSMVRSPSR